MSLMHTHTAHTTDVRTRQKLNEEHKFALQIDIQVIQYVRLSIGWFLWMKLNLIIEMKVLCIMYIL